MKKTNKKLDGSNILNAEYYTGRCPVECEQCFVNWGQQGMANCYAPLNKKNQKWFDYAVSEGWPRPPKDPTGQRLGKVQQASCWMIPMKPKRPTRERIEEIEVLDGSMLPCFLRVATMSDSSYSKREWNDNIRELWGDYCFFNSSIKAIKAKPIQLRETFHNIVITTNGGKQKMPKVPPAPPLGEKASFNLNANTVHGTMGTAKRTPFDFFNPLTLSDIGLSRYEDIVRFYRLRALPTVHSELNTDTPVVITPLRFRGALHIAEFCRRYKLHLEFHGSSQALKRAAIYFEFPLVIPPKGLKTNQARIWTDTLDDRNRSGFSGYASDIYFAKSYYRPIKEDFNAFPYVCDRANGGCAECGLCCTLDGSKPQWEKGNSLNPIPLVPYDNHYIANAYEFDSGNYFDALMEAQVGAWRTNPDAALDEADLSWIKKAIKDATEYVTQGRDHETYYVDSWNTHEDAEELVAFCYWCLLRRAVRAGFSEEQATAAVDAAIFEFADGQDILSGVEGLEDMWDDASEWSEQFGSVHDAV